MKSAALHMVTIVVVMSLVVLGPRSRSAYGWGPFAHCYGCDPNPDDECIDPLEIRAYVNLPDLSGNSYELRYWPPHGEIKKEFA